MAQKQELTLTSIKKTLKAQERLHLISLIYAAVGAYLFCGIVVGLMYFLTEDYSWHPAVFVVSTVIVLTTPALIIGHVALKYIKRLKMIRTGDILVVEDELVRIAINEFKAKYPSRDNTVNAYYFATYDRVEVWDNSELIYTSAGDKFYVVMYNDGKNKIELVYNQKIYQYINK